jgi:hypothetical protein
MQTIGRVRMEQNRGFLDQCSRKGWLETFSEPELRPEAWVDIMHGFLDQQVQNMPYFYWMAKFVSIYQLAHWLPQYVNGFLSLSRLRPGDVFDLTMVTQPRASPLFQGSTGFDAPPISRTLGIGANFILRELIRLEILDRRDERLWRYCYVPSLRVRRLIAMVTGDERLLADATGQPWEKSAQISEVLQKILGEDASFGRTFDIPFSLLSDSRYSNVRIQLLGDELATDLDVADNDSDCED